jgi:hypothetical protein
LKKNQIQVEKLVREILINNPKARDDDFELVAEYYYKLNPNIVDMKFGYIFLGHKELGLTAIESITRARRKIQSLNPELCSSKTKEKRKKLEEEYRDYYSKYEELKGENINYE